MDILPVELLQRVFSYLADRDVCVCCDVCRRWCETLCSRYFWTRRVRSVSSANWINLPPTVNAAAANGTAPVGHRICIRIEAPEDRLDIRPIVIRSNPLVYSSDRSAVIVERGRHDYYFSACVKPRLGAPPHLPYDLNDLVSKVVRREYSGETDRVCRLSLLRRKGNCVFRAEVLGSSRRDHRLVTVSKTTDNRTMFRSSASFSSSILVGLGSAPGRDGAERKVDPSSLCHYIDLSVGGSEWLTPFRFRVTILSDAKSATAEASASPVVVSAAD
ncbi:F-box domain protein [Nile crocodilepox virus]|uniref:F-box domain protein n=1 Tax=Nile crocodilepox virus (isolate Crocodylus niloticus/Zimbabwe/Ume/2001) TaxID=1289473 RepID=Q06ZY4_CPRVZ|nr:F-box domain protein [Nile crocodilepox virus]ABJ09058.1 F-box domain protein [Nile crocodilepox virus]